MISFEHDYNDDSTLNENCFLQVFFNQITNITILTILLKTITFNDSIQLIATISVVSLVLLNVTICVFNTKKFLESSIKM